MSLSFDTLQVLFWGLTYVMIIVAGIGNWSSKEISIPYLAVTLNFSWEINALLVSRGLWVHILWLSLDCFIVLLGFIFGEGKRRAAFFVKLLACLIAFRAFFNMPEGMLISSFAIDLIMAAAFVFQYEQMSIRLLIPIAAAKLIGDAFAGLAYYQSSRAVAVMALSVLCLNVLYLIICICRVVSIQRKPAAATSPGKALKGLLDRYFK